MEFAEVQPEAFATLKKTLKNRLPKSAMSYNILHMLETGMIPSSVPTKVYAFQRVIQEDVIGSQVFVVIIQDRQIYNDYAITVSTPSNITNEMKKAFDFIIDWSKSICFSAIDVSFSKDVADLSAKRGKVHLDPCDFMTVDLADALSINVNTDGDESLRVDELNPKDAELVAKRWQFTGNLQRTIAMMAEYIKSIGSAGVYLNGRLVSWVVITVSGSINALYTEDDQRNKGYGVVTMKKVCQVAGKNGLVPNVQVQLPNATSKRLMTKAGFKFSHSIEWVIYRPEQLLKN